MTIENNSDSGNSSDTNSENNYTSDSDNEDSTEQTYNFNKKKSSQKINVQDLVYKNRKLNTRSKTELCVIAKELKLSNYTSLKKE